MKIFFLAVTRLILEEKRILVMFRIIFQKIDIISNVIIAIAAILKNFFYQFFFNMTEYDCGKFHVKSIFLSEFTLGEGGHNVPLSGMITQKYSGPDRVNFH